jgi:hypothetical protein
MYIIVAMGQYLALAIAALFFLAVAFSIGQKQYPWVSQESHIDFFSLYTFHAIDTSYHPQRKSSTLLLFVSPRKYPTEVNLLRAAHARRIPSLRRIWTPLPSPLLPRFTRKRRKHLWRFRFGILFEVRVLEHLFRCRSALWIE